MSSPTLVCPDEPALIERLHGRALAVRVEEPAAVAGAARRVRDAGNQLACVLCDVPAPLFAVELRDDWGGVPIALGVPEAGRFRDLAPAILLRLRDLDVRVALPAGRPDNLVALRLLASLGIAGCADLAGPAPDWGALTDLMTYALLGTVPHAPVDPFEHIADYYEPDRATEWGATCFADPRRYLHLDARGRVALTREELLAGRFVADVADLDEETGLATHPALAARDARRRDFFERDRPCARCPGWRVCQGAFADPAAAAPAAAPGCVELFTELMDVVDQRRAQRARDQEPTRWRP